MTPNSQLPTPDSVLPTVSYFRVMKELLRQYASHNVWANQRLTELILSLPEEKQMQEVASSFNSLHLTLLHVWNSDSAWWQRIKLQERINLPIDTFKGYTKDVIRELIQQSKLWEEWISNASDLAINHVFQYQNSKKELFKQPVWQVLLHVFNHNTYHRGQLVSMLRQLGVEKIPQTDYIAWVRRK